MIQLFYEWHYIRDKEIIIDGNEWRGLIMIQDEDGRIIELYGYEKVLDKE